MCKKLKVFKWCGLYFRLFISEWLIIYVVNPFVRKKVNQVIKYLLIFYNYKKASNQFCHLNKWPQSKLLTWKWQLNQHLHHNIYWLARTIWGYSFFLCMVSFCPIIFDTLLGLPVSRTINCASYFGKRMYIVYNEIWHNLPLIII